MSYPHWPAQIKCAARVICSKINTLECLPICRRTTTHTLCKLSELCNVLKPETQNLKGIMGKGKCSCLGFLGRCCFLFFHIQEVIIKEEAEVVAVLLLVAVMVVKAVMVVGALCAERLHCVTAGSRKKRRRGREGSQESRGTARRERGVCLHWPRYSKSPLHHHHISFLTHLPAALLTCKGHFQTAPDTLE